MGAVKNEMKKNLQGINVYAMKPTLAIFYEIV